MRLLDACWASCPLLVALTLGAPTAACSDDASSADASETDPPANADAATDDPAEDDGTPNDGASEGDDGGEDEPSDAAVESLDGSGTTDASDAGDDDAGDAGEDAEASDGAATYLDIVLNEVQSQATQGFLASDFIELYNRSSASYTFPAGQWRVTDSDPTHALYVPGGTVIEGHGRLVLLPDDDVLPTAEPAPPQGALVCAEDGVNSAPFGLGSKDAVSLFYTGGDNASPETPVDTTTWTAHVSSRARLPDGGDWDASDTHTPTPGAANE